MERKPVTIDALGLPRSLCELIGGSCIFDSSCSNRAKVIFIDKGEGSFLKIAKEGSLRREAFMGRFLSASGLSARVDDYFCEDGNDYLLTARLCGEDATHKDNLSDPAKLCEILADALHRLHSLPSFFCPIKADIPFPEMVKDVSVKKRYSECMEYSDKELLGVLPRAKDLLTDDKVIHGDACLPNYIIDRGKFGGFVDVGEGGRGDYHIDLFWCVWSLAFNLKTNKYKDRFLDAYGRENIDPERLLAATAVNAI